MGYSPRKIHENKVYEITFRAISGLPFVCCKLIMFLLEVALARSNRFNHISICHYVWMGNHLHMIIFCHDPHGLTKFMGEAKKKITDYMKRLFNLEQLTLWEARSSIIELPTAEDLMNRLVYFYLNPNRAGLTQSINEYPGLTSWQTFLKVAETLEAREEKDLPWISALKLPILTKNRDPYWTQRTINGLKEKALITENLTTQPYKCLEAYGLTDADVPNFKAELIRRVNEGEAETPAELDTPKRSFKGSAALKKQEPTLTDWKPKTKKRRIFLICSDPELRKQLIAEYRWFFKLCRECYEKYLKGDRTIIWPPGAFQPPMPCSLYTI